MTRKSEKSRTYRVMNILRHTAIVIFLILVFVHVFPELGFKNLYIIGNTVIGVENCDKIVHIGDKLHYGFNYYKMFDLSAIVTRELILRPGSENEMIAIFPSYLGQLPSGHGVSRGYLEVPKSRYFIGNAKLVLKIKYNLFYGLRTLEQSFESEPFTIKE